MSYCNSWKRSPIIQGIGMRPWVKYLKIEMKEDDEFLEVSITVSLLKHTSTYFD